MKLRAVVTGWCLMAAGCSFGGQPATIITEPIDAGSLDSRASAEGAGDLVSYGPAAEDRLVLTTADGSVVLVDPDGGNELVLAGPSPDGPRYPAWSPIGDRIGWTRTEAAEFGRIDYSIVTANVDGSGTAKLSLPFEPFYFAWDSSASAIGALGRDVANTEGSALAVGVADLDTFGAAVDGSPGEYYFAWDSGNQRILAHAEAGLRLVIPNLEPTDLGVGEGLYQSPLPTGRPGLFVFAQGDLNLGAIRTADLETTEVRDVVLYRGNMSMLMHPDGTRVAIQSTGVDDDLDTATLDGLESLTLLDRGVDIVDLETGIAERVSDEPVAGFHWSPDGESLLMASFAPVGAVALLQWQLYENGELRTLGAPFTPSAVLSNVILPEFDLYGIGTTIWSPDGTRFTYAGRDASGLDGVWVFDVATGRPELVYEGGTLSFWSPG